MTDIIKLNNYINSFFDMSDILGRDNFINDSFFTTIDKFDTKYPYDIYLTQSELVFEIAAQGIQEKELDVSLEDGKLNVKYEKSKVEEKDDIKYIHHGMTRKSFNFSWKLDSFKYDLDKTGVTLKNGILKIIVPISKKAQAKKLEINK